MGASLAIPNAFQNQSGPIPLSQLDANFTAIVNSSNALSSYSNYYQDSSGAPNSIVVTVNAPQVFAYVEGINLDVKVANTTTSTAVTINVNSLGAKTVLNQAGDAPVSGQLVADGIYRFIYDGTNFQVQGPISKFSRILVGDGTVSSPSISFSSEMGSGFYKSASGEVDLSINGSRVLKITGTLFQSDQNIYAPDGSGSTPSLSFSQDPDTGLCRIGSNEFLAISGGVAVADFLNVAGVAQLLGPDGTSAIAGIGFISDTNTGFYRAGSDQIGVVTGGVSRLIMDTNGLSTQGSYRIFATDGSASTPSLSFSLETNTGFYRPTSNEIGITIAGSSVAILAPLSLTASSWSLYMGNGGTSAPAYSFASNTNTGMFLQAANSLSWCINGLVYANLSLANDRVTLGHSNTTTLALLNATTSSATAGSASALPALPQGYVAVLVNGVAARIPYYLS